MLTSPLSFSSPTHPQTNVCTTRTHTHTLTHSRMRAYIRNTISCHYSTRSNVNSLTPVLLLPQIQGWSHDFRFVDMYRQMLFWFVAMLPWGWPGCCSDHAILPVKEFYKIGFTHRICGGSVSWYSNDSIESSDLSCPLRCQFNCTSALQVDIFAGMQTILYLPYNILSALLYQSIYIV